MDNEIDPLSYPWAQEMLETVTKLIRDGILRWCNVVIRMGLDTESQNQWTIIFKEQIVELCEDMIHDVTAKQDRLFIEIEALLQKSAILCKDMHIKMPEYGSKGLSLSEEQELLKDRIQKYEKLLEEKRAEISVLNKQQFELCYALGRTPKTIPESPLPTPEFIKEFKQYLETLECEKFAREETFLDTKACIIEIIEELNYKPALDFEKTVISLNDSLFLVTDENMKNLSNFCDSLKEQLQNTKEEIASLRERITFLWELLAEDLINYDTFSQETKGNSVNTLAALRQEVKRCEDLKKANIEVFVKRLREELVTLWDKCHYTDKDRNFEFFMTDLYSEDLLTLHEMEIQKMKKYYDQNRDLFTLLEKRDELLRKWQILEQRARDRNRYKNRGGQLLQEEKERNALTKRIVEIKNQLLLLAKDFENRTGEQFLSWGQTIETIVFTAQEKYDQEKKLKLSASKHQSDKIPTPSKSTFLTPSTSSQNLAAFHRIATSVKRKPVATLFPAKHSRILAEQNENGPQTAPPTIMVNGKHIGTSNYCLERLTKENAGECSAEYTMFETGIQNKESCHSTIFLDAGSSNTSLAVPLPLTPRRVPVAAVNTLRRTPAENTKKPRTPRTGTKLTITPS